MPTKFATPHWILTPSVALTWFRFWFEQTHQSHPGQVEAYSWTGSSEYCSHCLLPCLEETKQTNHLNIKLTNCTEENQTLQK